jgi:putative transcriptional regulator
MATVTVTPAMAQAALEGIDWAAQDALSDDDIARQIADNPDAAPDLTLDRVKLLWRLSSGTLLARHRVRLVRRALGMSQAQFSRAYSIPLRTLQGWERGAREPDEAASALLKLIAFMPEETRAILSTNPASGLRTFSDQI